MKFSRLSVSENEVIMADFDFSQLSDYDFEILCIELLSRSHNKQYRRFKRGKDSGIDGRYYKADGTQDIIQCKHIALFSNLYQQAKTELEKVKKLNTAKYFFVTSCALNHNDKNKIFDIFNVYMENPDYVIGREDLNDILSQYPDILRKSWKLWLTSSIIFNDILNNHIYGRSIEFLEEMKREQKK